MTTRLIIVAVFLLLVLSVSGLPTGAPISTCNNLTSNHSSSPIDYIAINSLWCFCNFWISYYECDGVT